jgi:hypothetical protein
MDLRANFSAPPETVLLDFDHFLVVFVSLAFQYPTQSQRHLKQALVVLLLYVFLSA